MMSILIQPLAFGVVGAHLRDVTQGFEAKISGPRSRILFHCWVHIFAYDLEVTPLLLLLPPRLFPS